MGQVQNLKMVRPLTRELRGEVLQAFHDANIRPTGPKYIEWCEETAEALSCSIPQIRRVVTEHQSQFVIGVRDAVGTKAAQVAEMLGATLEQACEVMAEGMVAEEVTYLRDRNGDPVRDKDGNFVEIRKPLHDVRARYLNLYFKVSGSYAPQQFEVTQQSVLSINLSDEQLLQYNDEIAREIARVAVGRGAIAAAPAAQTAAPADHAGQACIDGQVVLADPMHKDD